MANKLKKKDLPRCPQCDVKPRWGHHYCACPICHGGVYGTVDATHQEVGYWWIEHVVDYYKFELDYYNKHKECADE